MAALRLVTVYFGSCALALWLANRFLQRISFRAALGLVLLPLLLTGRAILTGGYYGPLNINYQNPPLKARADTILTRNYGNQILSDVAIYMVPSRKAVRESVRNGHFPLWNRFILSGDVLLATAQSAALFPITIIGFLLPLSSAWTFN